MIDQDTGSDVPPAGMELVEQLRAEAVVWRGVKEPECVSTVYNGEPTAKLFDAAADALSHLTAENQRLRDQRDAYIRRWRDECRLHDMYGVKHDEAMQRVEELTRERDLAIAHDRQPYPTADAYERVCEARRKWQERAEKAEAALATARQQTLAEVLAIVDQQRAEWGRYSQGERAVRDVRVALAALASSPTETADAE